MSKEKALNRAEYELKEALQSLELAREYMVAAGIPRPETNKLYDDVWDALDAMYSRTEQHRETP